MYVVNLKTKEAQINLAAEEYFLKQKEGNYFILWRNSPSIIIGRNQNTFAEINIEYTEKNNIAVVRRLTGGGAVFHDLGNLNYTFIEQNADEKFGDYEAFSRPVIAALQSLGVDARLRGRNDLCIGDKKFSGNAQTLWHSRMLHHGTLLFSSDMHTLCEALKVNPLKIQSKGIKSIRSRVTNISEHLNQPFSVEEFCEILTRKALEEPGNEQYTLTPLDDEGIDRLYREKYSKNEWNYGYKKEYSFSNEGIFPCGIINVNFDIENGCIKTARIFGDFFGVCDIAELEKQLEGLTYDPASMKKFLEKTDINKYFFGISVEELLTVML